MTLHTESNILIRFVVAVEIGAGQIIACLRGAVDLAGGHHIDDHIFLAHDLIEPLACVGLAGIQRAAAGAEVFSEGTPVEAALTTDIVLIQQVHRRSVLRSQHRCVLSRKVQMSVLTKR